MPLSLSHLKADFRRTSRRIGRGHGSGRGTSAGKGTKGQRARSGGRKNLKRRGLKQFLQQLPKSRGFTSPHGIWSVVNISQLNHHFKDGETVTLQRVLERKLIRTTGRGLKVLG
ncbi:MAG: uL15 family ribosomal protein, partial [Patescibacteria group bacterium]